MAMRSMYTMANVKNITVYNVASINGDNFK